MYSKEEAKLACVCSVARTKMPENERNPSLEREVCTHFPLKTEHHLCEERRFMPTRKRIMGHVTGCSNRLCPTLFVEQERSFSDRDEITFELDSVSVNRVVFPYSSPFITAKRMTRTCRRRHLRNKMLLLGPA